MYSITFNKIDTKKDEITQLLAFNIGETGEQASKVFRKIETHYTEHKGEPEIVIDMLDGEDSIMRDYALSYADAKELAHSMGWDIETGELITNE